MAKYDFNNPSSGSTSRFGAKRSAGNAAVPGANTGNSKLVVQAKEDKPIEEKDVASALFAPPPEDDLGPQFEKKRRRRRKKDEVSVYEEQMDQRFAFDKRARNTIIVGVSLVVMFLAALLLPAGLFGINSTNPTISGLISGVSTNTQGLLNYLSGAAPTDPMGSKLFRYIIIIIAGAALGISGGVYQGALKNALASPTTLGVISGGTLGAMAYVIFFMPQDLPVGSSYDAQQLLGYLEGLSPMEYFTAMYGQIGCTLLGCFVAVAFTVTVALLAGKGKISNPVLIITGQVVTMVAGSVMTLIRTYYASGEGSEVTANALSAVRSASFSGIYTILDVVLMGIPILFAIGVIIMLRMRLNVLTFSDEEARSMGLSTTATRNLMVGACTLMTAVVVAFCGSIGFVGFVVPHLTRKVIGPDFRYYIPATALVGALFMVCVCFASSFFALEALGGNRLLTSVIGGVAFIAIALSGRRRTTTDGF
ncbi:MAG: iron ABC transporter permease [Coriobacteriia bacterium]|nr:iron ABC transporter permease [Coriobacteriia bacterium]